MMNAKHGGWLLRQTLPLLVPFAVHAQAPGWQAELGHVGESLSHGQAAWRQTDVALRGPVNPYATLEINARNTLRYGLRDKEAGLRLTHQLPARWQASLGATISPSHQVLARSTWALEAQRPWGEGWVAGVSLRSSRYEQARVNTWALAQEKYFATADGAQWRVAAQASVSQLPGAQAGRGQGGRVSIDRTAAAQWQVGLILATGREWESTGLPAAFAVHRVNGAALTARVPLALGWKALAEWSHAEVRGVHRREGIRLGVAHAL
jgi:YaiO family outer membrane protein